MSRTLRLLCLLGLVTSCTGGSETGNPVLGFDSSPCHRTGVAKGGGDAGMSSTDDDLGSHCVAWELDEAGELRLEVSDMRSGCEAHWKLGEGQWQQEGALRLQVDNGSCEMQAACLGCVYDLSFQIGGVDASAPLPITLWKQYACDSAELDAELTLPLDRAPAGILCQASDGAWASRRL